MSDHIAGFIIHQTSDDPISTRRRLAGAKPYLRLLKYLPAGFVQEKILPLMPVSKFHYATSDPIKDAFGNTCVVHFHAVPATPTQMLRDQPIGKVLAAGRCLEGLGCEIIGLGAYTSIIGDKGSSIARELSAAVTTGNSLTANYGVRGALRGADLMGVKRHRATACVLGAAGSVGSAVTMLIQNEVDELLIVGNSQEPLYRLKARLNRDAEITDLRSAVRRSQIVITVTSATGTLDINPEDFVPGAVVCDIARPRDISKLVSVREDVLVIDGGLVSTRGALLNADFGIAPESAYACMAETFILALAGRVREDYSIGRELKIEQVIEIGELADKLGFTLAGLRSFDRQVTDGDIARICDNAERKRATRRGGN